MERKSYVVLSTLVDSTIRENMPDVNFTLFRTIAEMEIHIASKSIRADTFYFTVETLKPTDTAGLNKLASIFNNSFFSVESIVAICSEEFRVQPINYINEQLPVKIDINIGTLNRSFVYSVIEGTLAIDDITEQHLVQLRMSKQKYLELENKRKELIQRTEEELKLLEDKYISDEEELVGVPEEGLTLINVPRSEEMLETINICGLNCKERRVFTFLMAQYLSLKGKVIFFESDLKYLELSDIVARSGLELTKVNLSELISDSERIISQIKLTTKNIIFISCDRKETISYDFIYNLLYVNLNGYAKYILVERDVSELSEDQDHIIVFPSTIPDLIQVIDKMVVTVKPSTRFVAVDMFSVSEFSHINEKIMTDIIKDIMVTQNVYEVLLFKMTSLVLGGEVHDLQVLLSSK